MWSSVRSRKVNVTIDHHEGHFAIQSAVWLDLNAGPWACLGAGVELLLTPSESYISSSSSSARALDLLLSYEGCTWFMMASRN
jgi:hypothetical protein